MFNVGMIRVYRLRCYSLEKFSMCVNVMMYLKCTFISAYKYYLAGDVLHGSESQINRVNCHRT